MDRGLLLYGAVSGIGLVLCIAETLKYAQQVQVASSVLQATDAGTLHTSQSLSAEVGADSLAAGPLLPTPPFESVSSVLSSLPLLVTVWSSLLLPSPRRLLAFFLRSKVNNLVALNLVISVLAAGVRFVQLRLFGPLSDNEKKACRENLFNFLVFRSVFVAAIVPLDVRELVVWSAFFAVIASLRLLCIIARERFATVTILPSATPDTFIRLLALIGALLLADVVVAVLVWLLLWRAAGASVVALLLFENVVVMLGCLKVSGKYLIHMLGLRRAAAWEERNAYLYYCEFVFECSTQLLTMMHYLHVWSLYGLSVTIIDLFLFLHLRSSCLVLVDRISKFHHYRRASVEINSRYADATAAELAAADDYCAICREAMDSAKKLPCGHLFHRSCITQWMEYKGICPSCRAPLLHPASAREAAGVQQRQQQQQQQRLATMYPAQAAAHIAAQQQQQQQSQQQQHASDGAAAGESGAAAVNDDNLEATMALIRQLQAQDAAQFGMLGFGMLSLGGGSAGGRRAGAAPAASGGGDNDEKSAAGQQTSAAGVAVGGGVGGAVHHPIRGMIGRSLFHFNSRSIASWLPSFSFEVVRSISDDIIPPSPQRLPQQQQPAAVQHAASAPPPPPSAEPVIPPAAGGTSTAEVQPDAAPSASQPSSSSSVSSAVAVEEEKDAEPAAAVTLPSALTAVARASSDRSRRDVILEATQRRLQATAAPSSSVGSSGSSTSSASSPSVSPTYPLSPSSGAAAPLSSGAAAAAEPEDDAAAAEARLVAAEQEDATYDDINGGIDGDGPSAESAEEEWSDEDALVARIRPVLDAAVRQVEVHALPPPRPSPRHPSPAPTSSSR